VLFSKSSFEVTVTGSSNLWLKLSKNIALYRSQCHVQGRSGGPIIELLLTAFGW
jgi:hypothetical protein